MCEHTVKGKDPNKLLPEIMLDVTGDLLKDFHSQKLANAYGVFLNVMSDREEIVGYKLYVSSNREYFDTLKREVEAKRHGYTPICVWFNISDQVKEELSKIEKTDPDIVWYLLHDATKEDVINENVIENNLKLYRRANGI